MTWMTEGVMVHSLPAGHGRAGQQVPRYDVVAGKWDGDNFDII
jgi:hypothetical protein